ncbi:Glutaredoxin [Limnospira platensis C1]|nr:Glutaredoxin [Arthrospira platensis C1]
MLDFLNNIIGRNPGKFKAKVEVYSWQTCPYCIRAKLLLWWKGVEYTDYQIDGDNNAREAMAQRG